MIIGFEATQLEEGYGDWFLILRDLHRGQLMKDLQVQSNARMRKCANGHSTAVRCKRIIRSSLGKPKYVPRASRKA